MATANNDQGHVFGGAWTELKLDAVNDYCAFLIRYWSTSHFLIDLLKDGTSTPLRGAALAVSNELAAVYLKALRFVSKLKIWQVRCSGHSKLTLPSIA